MAYGSVKFKKIKTINDFMPLFLPYIDKLYDMRHLTGFVVAGHIYYFKISSKY